ncbi:MAG: 30S ribosomal protein S6 [Sphingomonadales bacterium]
MAFYEHVFITRPDMTEAQVKTMTDDFTKILKDNGGKVAKNEYWGLRTLAYKIKKNKKGHYILFNIDGPHPAVAELERKQRLTDNILRFMTIRVDEMEEGPSIMMRSKSSGDYDRRGARGGDRPPRKFEDKKPDVKKTAETETEDKKTAAKKADDTKADATKSGKEGDK